MKLNKRVIASAALSVSLATSAVAPPVAWADEKQVNCPQKFRVGSDFNGDVNTKVGKHLQRDCKFPTDQISRLSIRDEEFGETTEAGTGDDQQSEPLKVNEVKAGDREITGLVFLLPGQKKTVQVFYQNLRTSTVNLQSSAESGGTSRGEYVSFKIEVPNDVELRGGDRLLFNLQPSNDGKNKSIEVYVKPADNGNGQAPGGGADEKPRKPHSPDGKPGKPSVPGADGNPRTGGGSLSSGSS
ncbi:intracellular motility protein A [Corynebacterium belfantii]|uniref:intracellular motility protein A n=1 Tax=Corynebacterium belfantii TaxID=2014537 RepID=UPI001F1CDAD4|nr:intracellular motility protein A [Corynebacterium belfantii]